MSGKHETATLHATANRLSSSGSWVSFPRRGVAKGYAAGGKMTFPELAGQPQGAGLTPSAAVIYRTKEAPAPGCLTLKSDGPTIKKAGTVRVRGER
jgi:hypothetical protein